MTFGVETLLLRSSSSLFFSSRIEPTLIHLCLISVILVPPKLSHSELILSASELVFPSNASVYITINSSSLRGNDFFYLDEVEKAVRSDIPKHLLKDKGERSPLRGWMVGGSESEDVDGITFQMEEADAQVTGRTLYMVPLQVIPSPTYLG